MFELYADKSKLVVRRREPVTSGSVDAHSVRIQFSDAWDGLSRTAVFRAGGETRSVLLGRDGEAAVPWEVLREPGCRLFAGVYGAGGGGRVLPTVWADLGLILEGTAPAEEAQPPVPDLWEQKLSGKGDALELTGEGTLGLFSGDRLLSAVNVQPWGVGHGLTVKDGDLTLVTTDDFAGDNTLPITAAGVETVVGNIEALLGAI